MANQSEARILEDVKHYFGFLFEKGYQVREIRYSGKAFWHVILESSRSYMRIDCDQYFVSVMFDPEKINRTNQIGLGTLIYYLSKGQQFVGYFEGNPAWGKNKQMERLASLLRQYHDQIAPLFDRDVQRLREDLALSQKKYAELLQASYSRKFAVEEKVWKGLNLLVVPFKLIGLGFLAYLGWGVSVLFITETDIGLKLLYGSIAAAIIVVLGTLALRF